MEEWKGCDVAAMQAVQMNTAEERRKGCGFSTMQVMRLHILPRILECLYHVRKTVSDIIDRGAITLN